MKRLLKLLTYLYPSAWRNRYAAEYEALLEDATPRPQDAFNVLWAAIKMQLTSRSFVGIVLPCTIAGAILAAAVSFVVSPRYVSQTLITVTESAPVTEETMKHVLATLRAGTLDRDFLASVIQKYDLYPHERSSMPSDQVIDKMLQSITVKPLQRSSARSALIAGNRTTGFALGFVYSDPHLAQLVEGDLVSQFVRTNMRRAISAAANRQTGEVVRVEDAPNLPNSPSFPKRGLFAVGGLITGLLCGLILATIFGSPNKTAVASN